MNDELLNLQIARRPVRKPLSLYVFLAGTALSLGVLAPLAFAGFHFERPMLFLVSTGLFAVASLTAAFMGFRFMAALAAGQYRTLQERPLRDQVW